MRCIIAGSRDFTDQRLVDEAMETCGFASEVTEVVCGMARGVDTLGLRWANRRGLAVARYPANWDRWGKRAGLVRNEEMARNAEALVAIPGEGPGTKHMITMAWRYELRIYIVEFACATSSLLRRLARP
jgi:hypothetical protein